MNLKEITVFLYQNFELMHVTWLQVIAPKNLGQIFVKKEDMVDLLSIFADPKRNRRTPVPVTRDRPITRVLQPVGKSLLPHEFWNPIKLTHGSNITCQLGL